jgi:hypothetical protein
VTLSFSEPEKNEMDLVPESFFAGDLQVKTLEVPLIWIGAGVDLAPDSESQ